MFKTYSSNGDELSTNNDEEICIEYYNSKPENVLNGRYAKKISEDCSLDSKRKALEMHSRTLAICTVIGVPMLIITLIVFQAGWHEESVERRQVSGGNLYSVREYHWEFWKFEMNPHRTSRVKLDTVAPGTLGFDNLLKSPADSAGLIYHEGQFYQHPQETSHVSND